MSSGLSRTIQVVIDRLRGKPRSSDPADRWGVGPREARRRARPSGELEKLFYAHDRRVAHKWHHYLEIYERHFEPLRQRLDAPRILELGVSRGGSLQLWRKYFGPAAKIVGIDIDPACASRIDTDASIVIGDQSDPNILAAAIDRLGGVVDIVIDDGSHLGRHQIASFEYLYPRLSERGLYLCEDLHCSYWPSHEGGIGRPGTFVEFVKAHIDNLHAWFLDGTRAGVQDFAATTYGIFIYLNIVVIEKRPIAEPFHIQIGRKPAPGEN
jgi:hypothetical protein